MSFKTQYQDRVHVLTLEGLASPSAAHIEKRISELIEKEFAEGYQVKSISNTVLSAKLIYTLIFGKN